MKEFLDRLNGLFEDFYDGITGKSRDSGDPDLDNAWAELDADLKRRGPKDVFEDLDRSFAEFDRKFDEAKGYREDFERIKNQQRNEQTNRMNQGKKTEDDVLREHATQLVRDYNNLECKPGASADEIRSSWKRLMKQYHPDRFAGDPEKMKTANLVSAKLNESYNRLLEHLGEKK